jgi:hypothetical protein
VPSGRTQGTWRELGRAYAEVCCRVVGSARVRYFFASGTMGIVDRVTGAVTIEQQQ